MYTYGILTTVVYNTTVGKVLDLSTDLSWVRTHWDRVLDTKGKINGNGYLGAKPSAKKSEVIRQGQRISPNKEQDGAGWYPITINISKNINPVGYTLRVDKREKRLGRKGTLRYFLSTTNVLEST